MGWADANRLVEEKRKMNKLWKNWTVHNIIAHPASEVLYLISILFVGRERAESISGWIHDVTLPDQLRTNTQKAAE